MTALARVEKAIDDFEQSTCERPETIILAYTMYNKLRLERVATGQSADSAVEVNGVEVRPMKHGEVLGIVEDRWYAL